MAAFGERIVLASLQLTSTLVVSISSHGFVEPYPQYAGVVLSLAKQFQAYATLIRWVERTNQAHLLDEYKEVTVLHWQLHTLSSHAEL